MIASPSRWRFAVLPLVSLGTLLPNLVRSHVAFGDVWPAQRPMILDATLLFAGALLVAALAAGLVAWRRGPHA